jgi:hypothetical protein
MVAGYAVDRSTEYVPGFALLVSALPPDPELSEGLPPWERLHPEEELNEGTFSAWGANLMAQVARPETAWKYFAFMQMATGVAALSYEAVHLYNCMHCCCVAP